MPIFADTSTTRAKPRLPDDLLPAHDSLAIDKVYHGDSRELLKHVTPESVSLSFWSPPYFVGKSYEKEVTFREWQDLLGEVIGLHEPIIKPGGFLVVNIADILCFADPTIPRFQAESYGSNRLPISREDVLSVMAENPGANRHEVARILGLSEQTVDRRMKNNNVRGGEYAPQTRVQLVGCFLEEAARKVGLPLYDRRIWVKDPTWENSQWHSNSFRVGVSWYEAKMNLIRDAVRTYLDFPTIRLFPTATA